jgi:hypothetical protein
VNWVFLKPLPVGNHTIYFKGGLKNITDSSSHDEFAGPYGWDYPNTYHITVVDNGHLEMGKFLLPYGRSLPAVLDQD